jgi:hypothetical protein
VVTRARDDAFVLPDTSRIRAGREGLIDEDGRRERGIAQIIRASAAGEGYGVQALDLVTGQWATE